jgi:sterol desaturase/sphingolipid hydroxylase (fatty acid hydroxylase superfamily)
MLLSQVGIGGVMKTPEFLLMISVPAIILASLIEAFLLSRREKVDWRELGLSLLNFIVRNVALIALPLSVATPIFELAWRFRLTTIAVDNWLAVALLFFGQEFFYYWFHRASHRIRWFWINHAVHHSPNHLNLSASYRSFIFGHVFGDAIFFVPLVWIGFPPRAVLLTLTFNLLYQTWIHVTWIPKLGPLEWIFNTPSAHRVHHAVNVEYLDANYGGVLTIFDRLFGTYIEEREDLPCRYGLVHPQTSRNPLRVEFDQWRGLMIDLFRARKIGHIFGFLAKPPGWRPDGPGETTEELRRRAGTGAPMSHAAE